MKTHLEETLAAANEARHRAYVNGDPLWNAVADREVDRLHQLARATDDLTDEPCGYVPEPLLEFAPVWKEALSDSLVCGSPPLSRAFLTASGALTYCDEVAS